MSDYFARIGLALSNLLAASTVNGDARVQAQQLADELQAADDNINQMVEDRVQAHVDTIGGRLQVLEESNTAVRDRVFSNEMAVVIANASTIVKMDGDGDGLIGGSLPAEPTLIQADMTVAQLKEAILAAGGEVPAKATKADLIEVLGSITPADPGEDTITSV